jgi:5'-phosphate synthase pdxT subunit
VSDKIGVLALQGDVREHGFAVAELGGHPVEVRQPEDLAGVAGLILPGGESTTISLLLLSSQLHEPVDERLRAGMPAMGTCAGMILLATELLDGRPDQRTFGAIDIAVRRNAFGRQVDSFETDLAVPELGPERLHAVFIRAPLVERTGPGVEVLASVESGEGERRPVACRAGSILVTAFHPELSGDLRLHELFLKGC